MSKKTQTFTEAVFFKGDMDKDGAPFRINEIRILMKAASELCGAQFKEDSSSYALFGPEESIREGDNMADAFIKQILSRVDVCGIYSDQEVDARVKKIVSMAKEKELVCGIDTIIKRSQSMIMHNNMSVREWTV